MRFTIYTMIERNVSLREYTTIRIGGTALYFAKLKKEEELSHCLEWAKDRGVEVFILGRGANTILGDFDGLVINTRKLSGVEVRREGEGLYVRAMCGTPTWELVKLALSENLEGIYKLAGFPASVGGAVAMNAGAFGYEIKDDLLSVRFLGWDGKVYMASKEELDFSYRKSPFPELGAVLSAEFFFRRAQGDVKREYERIRKKRMATQPINMPTSGSTFKNPEGDYAGRLLEKVGMKGYRVGDVAFSDLHANFLVNLGRASFHDVLKILEEAKRRVYEAFGIILEEEVRLVESGSFDGRKVSGT